MLGYGADHDLSAVECVHPNDGECISSSLQSSLLRKSLKGLLCSLITSSGETNRISIKVYEHIEASPSLQLPALPFIHPRPYPVSLTFLPPGSSPGGVFSRQVLLKCVFQMCLALQIWRESLSGNLSSLKDLRRVADTLHHTFFY